MVNSSTSDPDPDPGRALALSYALPGDAAALAALFALDATLGQILRTTREPLIGQMRLTWWFEALEALDRGPPPAQPVLQALAARVLPRGVTGAELGALIDGWEALLDPEPLTDERLEAYAVGRGGVLFALGGRTVRASDDLFAAGAGWALADFSSNVSDAALAARVRTMAVARLTRALPRRVSRRARTLAALALLARMTLAEPAVAAPARVARLAWHRLTGR